jgi:hypothetical protein
MPGHIRLASASRVPVFTPKTLASMLAAMQLDESAITGTIPTGRPRKAGSSCCSTEAK